MPALIKPRVVYVPGVFDLLHRGHINLLWRARQLGDILIVGVVSSEGCNSYKGRFPAQSVSDRINAIKQLTFVDVVEVQQTTDPTQLLERYLPDVLIHGNDWEKLIEGNETLQRLGIELVLLPYTIGISSTSLREQGASS